MSGVPSRWKWRWSSAAAPAPRPWSIATLAGGSAYVFVGPPLLTGDDPVMIPVPVLLKLPPAENPHFVPESASSLYVPGPDAVPIAKKQPPAVLPLRIVLLTETAPPPWLLIPYPLLLAIVSWF